MQQRKKVNYIDMSDGAYIYSEYIMAQGGKSSAAVDAVVFIPGFCCTTRFFEKNVYSVSREYDVIVYDPRGQGNSSKGLQGHTVERNARDLYEILEYYGKERAVIVAWSMAGQFITDYIRQFKTRRLSAVVTADCPLHALGDEEWNAHGLREYNMEHFNAHLRQSYNDWENYCLGFAKKIWSGIDDSMIQFSADEFAKTPPWIAFAIYSDMVYRNGYPYLSQAEVPMLFTGADSRVTENGKELAAHWYPAARDKNSVSEVCTFESGGHVFFYVNSERFNEKLLGFINSKI